MESKPTKKANDDEWQQQLEQEVESLKLWTTTSTMCPDINCSQPIKRHTWAVKALKELLQLRAEAEANRKRVWPDEKPDFEGMYIIYGYLPDAPHVQMCDVRQYWHAHGFPYPMTITHWQPINHPAKESRHVESK